MVMTKSVSLKRTSAQNTHEYTLEVKLYWGLFLLLTSTRITGGFYPSQSAAASLGVSFYCSGDDTKQDRIKWLKRKCWEVYVCVLERGERDQTTYYSDVDLLTVRQTGEPCHAAWTNRRLRNGATYDINAGMGRALPAWGSFPMSRQTEGAYSDTLTISRANTHALCFVIHVQLIVHKPNCSFS